jgi:hypothetical protein
MDVKSFIESKDPLKAFAHWYIKKIITDKVLPIDTIYNNVNIVSNCYGVVLFKQYPFQVQLWLCKSNEMSPEHTHPDVDTYEVYFGGDIIFTKNGKVVKKRPQELPNFKSSAWGWFSRINANDKHQALINGTNSSFLSIQYWKNNIPATSIEKNWKGNRFGENHNIN